jgi:hypothetical protein
MKLGTKVIVGPSYILKIRRGVGQISQNYTFHQRDVAYSKANQQMVGWLITYQAMYRVVGYD